MGLDRTIRFPSKSLPAWDAIRVQLRRVGEDARLRMIDGLPAFPDEEPDDDWREIRVGLTAGMLTLRRGLGLLSCVAWGNADADLTAAWDKLTWAAAAAGDGLVDTPAVPVSADQFAQAAGLAPS